MSEQPGLRPACRGIVGRVDRRANGQPRLAHTVGFCSLGFPSADGPATGMIRPSLREIADPVLPESAPARACGFRSEQQHLSDFGGPARDLLDEWSEWNRVRGPRGFRQAGRLPSQANPAASKYDLSRMTKLPARYKFVSACGETSQTSLSGSGYAGLGFW